MSSFGRIVKIGLVSYDACRRCGVHANERLCRKHDDARTYTLAHGHPGFTLTHSRWAKFRVVFYEITPSSSIRFIQCILIQRSTAVVAKLLANTAVFQSIFIHLLRAQAQIKNRARDALILWSENDGRSFPQSRTRTQSNSTYYLCLSRSNSDCGGKFVNMRPNAHQTYVAHFVQSSRCW